jgi:alpha-galactosidase
MIAVSRVAPVTRHPSMCHASRWPVFRPRRISILLESAITDAGLSVSDRSTARLERVDWAVPGLRMGFGHAADTPLHLLSLETVGCSVTTASRLPLVEILAAGRGHTLANSRLVQTSVGAELRYVAHELAENSIRFELATPDGILAQLLITGRDGAFRASTSVVNATGHDVLLVSVTTWVSPFGGAAGPGFEDPAGGWVLVEGASDWLGEGRWTESTLRQGALLPTLREDLTGHTPRQAVIRTANGTWSTGGHLPVAGVRSEDHDMAWLWEVVHNGPWRWEVGEHRGDCYFALAGPTDWDHW